MDGGWLLPGCYQTCCCCLQSSHLLALPAGRGALWLSCLLSPTFSILKNCPCPQCLILILTPPAHLKIPSPARHFWRRRKHAGGLLALFSLSASLPGNLPFYLHGLQGENILSAHLQSPETDGTRGKRRVEWEVEGEACSWLRGILLGAVLCF